VYYFCLNLLIILPSRFVYSFVFYCAFVASTVLCCVKVVYLIEFVLSYFGWMWLKTVHHNWHFNLILAYGTIQSIQFSVIYGSLAFVVISVQFSYHLLVYWLKFDMSLADETIVQNLSHWQSKHTVQHFGIAVYEGFMQYLWVNSYITLFLLYHI